jgi:NADH dehydrogenase
MILVVGATGILGSEICRRLAAAGKPIRALVRQSADAGKIGALKSMGAELVHGDLRDRASLDAACKGVDAVISSATTTLSRQPGDSIEATDQAGQVNLVEAAKAAGVKHFIFVSYSGNIDAGDDPCPLTVAKRTVEQRVRESGMGYTILRPSVFMEIWLSPVLGFDYPNGKVTVYGSGDGKISYISLGDVAEFAVQSLDHPAARNAVIELGGPEPLSQKEAVALFEKAAGKKFEVVNVPMEALQAQKAAASDSLSKSFATLILAQVHGDVVDMSVTQKSFPIQLCSVDAYAERAMSTAQAG